MNISNMTARHFVLYGRNQYQAYDALDRCLGTYSSRRAALRRVILYFRTADEHELKEYYSL